MGTSEAPTPRVGSAAREAIFAQLADAGRSEQVAQRLTRSYVRVDVKNPRVCGDLPGVSGDGSVYFSPIGMGWLSSSNARRWM
ncbi:MAG TPA: hypothetical protein VIJ18_12870, partial [Microbacteriaceae bacterium]